MLKHEARLIDPDAEQLVAALSEATAGANKRCRARLLEDRPEKWRKFARAAAARPEGWELFRGGRGGVPATQLLAAWWTDAAGRKHVVLRGRRVEHDEAKRLLHKEDLEQRPPLWHAYPEYVCRRTVGKESQIVCACGCGAVGTPESLGWMGETCGPCFDRKEEVGSGALRANLPGVLYGDREPLRAVACSPDGNRVAAVEGDNCVTFWDIPTRTRTTMKFGGQRLTDVAFTADGRHLLAAGMDQFLMGGVLAAFDATADPPRRVDPEREAGPPTWAVEALPDPGLALAHRVELPNYASRAEVVRVPSGERVRAFDLTPGSLGRLAVSPDGTRLATCGNRLAVYDLAAAARVFDVAVSCGHAAFSHDGRLLFVESRQSLAARDAATGRPLFSVPPEDRKRMGTTFETVTVVAADPRGEFVFAGLYDGRVCAFAADTLRLRAIFEWHLGTVIGLAASADGSRLFSSGGDGCVKVWPIRDLLRET